MMRSEVQAIRSTIDETSSARPMRQTSAHTLTKAPPKKRPKHAAAPTKKPKMNVPPKKRTKKQLAEDADNRRRALAVFDKVWGSQNGADGRAVEPSRNGSRSAERIPNRAISEDTNADMNTTCAANADMSAAANTTTADQNTTSVSNDEDDHTAANASTHVTSRYSNETYGNVASEDDSNGTAPRAYSEEEAYDPDDAEDDDNDSEDQNADDEEKKDDKVHQIDRYVSRVRLQELGGSTPLRFDISDALGPNIVDASGGSFLETDGEGGDDEAADAADGTSDDTDSDSSEAEQCTTASL
ncbi:hypothetical protein PHYPSEUDO_001890 [Phytophthora pseudosyringae]|uniref:Uncharacterized protein n=1 Tax=Phytophthora pseudosyringae TaxID=221518 RepID=A0A8T1WEM0_9STRA|nr:hypothetical protein PHYPSEUDO_001890 [Phytophthora pseudosyringae]